MMPDGVRVDLTWNDSFGQIARRVILHLWEVPAVGDQIEFVDTDGFIERVNVSARIWTHWQKKNGLVRAVLLHVETVSRGELDG